VIFFLPEVLVKVPEATMYYVPLRSYPPESFTLPSAMHLMFDWPGPNELRTKISERQFISSFLTRDRTTL
jgi:hypothetical protein